MKNVSYDQAINLVVNYNAKLIDTQLEEDYCRKHLQGSINIPVEQINNYADAIHANAAKVGHNFCLAKLFRPFVVKS